MTGTIAITEELHFAPRFKDLEEDSSQLRAYIIDLYHDDQLGKVYDRAMALMEPAVLHLHAAYWDEQRYDALERYYTYTFEVPFGWPGQELLDALERLVSLGEGPRAIRILRNYLALQKQPFWSRIDDRKRGFQMSKYWAAPEAEQRRAHAQLIAPISEYRDTLLAMMDFSRDLIVRAGATEAQLARLATERAEVVAEQRTRPGKPDPRKMDEAVFWELIGTPDDGALSERIDALPDRLAKFKATQIKVFDGLLHEMSARAYRQDIRAFAYLLNGGCSDDAFEGFRAGLIMLGLQAFAAVLADPDGFDPAVGIGDGLALMDVPPLAYEMRQGAAMKRKMFKVPELAGPELDEDDFAKALPRVAAQV